MSLLLKFIEEYRRVLPKQEIDICHARDWKLETPRNRYLSNSKVVKSNLPFRKRERAIRRFQQRKFYKSSLPSNP